MQFIFSFMDKTVAEAILAWRYEGAYAVYTMANNVEVLAEMLDRRSPYYVVRDEQGELVGFFNVGTSSLVWDSSEPGIYEEELTIAIGLGMRPDMTGKGMGLAFVQACLNFAQREFAPERFHLYVFPWNKRAICVYERAGFQRVGTFMQCNIHGEREFLEMSRDAPTHFTVIDSNVW